MKIYHLDSFQLRAVALDDDIYFVGKDLAKILGYKNERDAIRNHVRKHNKETCAIPDDRGVLQQTNCISVDGALELINTCRNTQWVPMVRNWFNSKVLPDAVRYRQALKVEDEYNYWMTPVYTYKDILKRLDVNTNVLADFLMNHNFMDEEFHLMNKGIFIDNHKFTRVGYEFIKEMMKAEGFKK